MDEELNKLLQELLLEHCKIQDNTLASNDILNKALTECQLNGIPFSELKEPIEQSEFTKQDSTRESLEKELQDNMSQLDLCLKDINSKTKDLASNINKNLIVDATLSKLKEYKDLYEPIYQYHFELKNQADLLLQKRQTYLDSINVIRTSITNISNTIDNKTLERDKYSTTDKTLSDNIQKEINSLNLKKNVLKTKLEYLVNREKNKIKFDSILNTEFIIDDTAIDKDAAKKELLNKLITGAFLESNISIFSNAYASNLTINATDVEITKDLNFKILFDFIHQSIDLDDNIKKENILNILQKKSFITNLTNFTIEQIPDEYKYSGILYEQYYNLFQDPINNFFSLDERGLTSDQSKIDIELKNDIEVSKQSGIDISNSVKIDINGITYYIKDFKKFQEFNSTIQSQLNIRINEIKESKIKPSLDKLIFMLKELATTQIKYILAYGDLFSSTLVKDDLIIDLNNPKLILNINSDLSSIINTIHNIYNSYNSGYKDLTTEIHKLESEQLQNISVINNFKNDLSSVQCSKKTGSLDELTEPEGAGIDPLGRQSLKNGISISNPNITKWCYWVKFAKIATMAGLLPIPEAPSFRYWPYGLVVPTPAGPKKIQLPPVFIPITVISSNLGTIVIFVVQCGILPCPLVFYISKSGVKKFLITLKGESTEFGQPNDSSNIKDFLQAKLNILKNFGLDKLKLFGISKPELDFLKKIGIDQTFDEFTAEIYSELAQKIDAIQLPPMTNFNKLKDKLGKSLNDLSIDEKINLIKLDFYEYIDNIDFPTLELPKDKTKIYPKKNSGKSINDLFKDYNTNKYKDDNKEKRNLKTKILNEIDKLDISDIVGDIPDIPINDENLVKIKDKWNKILSKSFDKIKNNPELAFSLLNIQQLNEITIGNPFNCKDELPPINIKIPGAALEIIIIVEQLIASTLNLLTSENIKEILSLESISPSRMKDSLKIIIKKTVPDKFLPDFLYDFSIINIMKNTLINIYKTLELSFNLDLIQAGIKIDMNILKEPIKKSLDDSIKSITKSFHLSIDTDFINFSPTDMKVLFKKTIKDSIEVSSAIFETPFNTIPALKSIKDINLMDVMTGLLKNPLMLFGKNANDQINLTNIKALNDAYKVLENAIPIPFVASLYLIASGNTKALQTLHPILEYDDLPPWERLSLDNFIFMLFMDSFLHTTKQRSGF